MANVVSIERRDAHTRIEHLDDGTHRAIIQRGQHYFNRDTGKFEDCDNNIYPDTMVSGFTHNAKAGEARTRFAHGGKFRFGLKHPLFVTYNPRGANNVAPIISGNKAHFSDLWPSVDVELTKFPEGTKEDIILKDASAPSSFTWDLEEIAGVVPTMQADGSLAYVEMLTGEVIGRIPAPTVHDAAGVSGTATLTYAAGAITIAIDPVWLAAPERVFPVALDPTTVTLQPSPGKDAYVESGNALLTHNTDFLFVGDSSGDAWRAFLQPDLSSLPANAAITNAQLSLYVNGPASGATALTASVYRVTAAWAQTTLTWNNQPAHDATSVSTLSGLTNVSAWATWTGLGGLLQSWFSGAQSNYGVIVRKAVDGTAAVDYKQFFSSDYVTDPTLRPKWTITYGLPPTVTATSPTGSIAAPGTVNDEVTPRLSWTYSDPDSDPQVQYQVRVYDTSNNLIYDSGAVASANAFHDVPLSAGLKYGVTYGWQARVYDGISSWSAYTALTYFKCTMSAPTGLVATADAANARINLAWTAHPGENLAGYRVYRRPSGGTWTRLNRTLVTSTSYTDDAAASGQSYDYYVTAAATDGYESPASASVTQTVTFSGAWIDSLKLEATPRVFEAEDEWVGSVQRVLGRSTPVVFRRPASRKLRISGYCTSKANMDALRNTLVPGIHRYVDALGEVYRFELTGPLSYPKQAPFPTAATTVYEWSFECVEVM